MNATTLIPFSVVCPSCGSSFPVDPKKVPEEGVHAICSTCLRTFRVESPEVEEPDAGSMMEVAGMEGVDGAAAVEVSDVEDADGALRTDVPTPNGEYTTPVEPIETADEVETPIVFEDLSGLVSDSVLAEDDPTGDVEGKTLFQGANRFGRRDPGDRARRLARVLVSDIIAYHPQRYREALAAGTLRDELADEVDRSWEEYVQQVGRDVAESTPYFTEALNEILAKGEEIF